MKSSNSWPDAVMALRATGSILILVAMILSEMYC